MVFSAIPFEAWPTEVDVMGQVPFTSHVKLSRYLASSFSEADDGDKPRVVCPPGNDMCYCAEGHRCIQSFPEGPQAQGVDFQEYIEGCPANEEGDGWISPYMFNSKNQLCADEKCTCVLKREPNEDAPQFSMVPSLKGDWRLVKNRYEMPKSLTEDFVDSVRGEEEGKEGGAIKDSIWLTADEWKNQYPEVMANMNRVMRTMHRKVVAIESMFEEPTDPGAEGKDNPALGPQPPPEAVPKEIPAQTVKDDEGERTAKLIMAEFRVFQQMCSRLQTQAQALGLANDGEGGLNCFDDYRERLRLEETSRAVAQLGLSATPGMAEFLNTLKLPSKEHGYRNLLIVGQLVRDMGPDENDALWLPRPPNPHPPTLPEEMKESQPKEDDKSEVDPTEGTDPSPQSMVFDVQAAAAMAGWAASRPFSRWSRRRRSRAPRDMSDFLTSSNKCRERYLPEELGQFLA
jgi:hypothetical protein